MSLSQVKISTRLVAMFGLIAVLLLTIAGAALLQMGSMRAATSEITENWLPSVELVNKMNTGISDFRIQEFKHVLNTDENAMGAIEKKMGEILSQFEEDHQAYVKLISSPEERKLYDEFAGEWKTYLQMHEQVIGLSRKNANDQAKKILEGESEAFFDSCSVLLDKLVDLNHAGGMTASHDTAQAYALA